MTTQDDVSEDLPATPEPRQEKASQHGTRNTTRASRQRANEAAKALSQREAAELIPPKGEEKARRIAANKAADVAAFGTTSKSRREARQAANRAQAEREAAQLATAPAAPLAHLLPGQQVDNLTARRMAKFHDQDERNENREAAKAAGLAVFETLKGRPMRDRRTTARRIAQHNATVDRAARAAATATV